MKLPNDLPADGTGEEEAYFIFKDAIAEGSAKLGSPTAFAHMDPPTPQIAARIVGLNAAENQNLLHPDLSPLATVAEKKVIEWLAPVFGMAAGHMCAGSTLANLTALWAAREAGAKRVVASADAHISIPKAAHILGMYLESIEVDSKGRLDRALLPNLKNAALVLTAGTTSRGMIDPLMHGDAMWLHVDAAWAGPLKLTRHADLLNGIENADSVAISAHKWLYQPKDSAIILFKNADAQDHISFGSAYLAAPNVGLQGSRGAAALPLLATLLAWGQKGLAKRIEKNMADALSLAQWLENNSRIELQQMPQTGVINWRPKEKSCETIAPLLVGVSSTTKIESETWMRQVAANPHVDLTAVRTAIENTL